MLRQRRRLLDRHRRAEEDPVLPVECLGDERHDRRPPTAEQKGVYRFAGLLLSDAWALRGGRRKSRVRVRSRLVRLGRPVVALPVDRMLRRLTGHALPPDVARRSGRSW